MGKEVANVSLGKQEITFKDNSPEVMEAFFHAVERGLDAIGITAEGYAKKELSKVQAHAGGPDRPYIDTGRLRNSITHATKTTQVWDFSYSDEKGTWCLSSIGTGAEENAVYIGTNVEYAPFVEMGTGIYAEDEDGTPNGEGRPDPWAYQDDDGNWHMTRGIKPVHFLKKAASEHTDEYKNLLKESMENA